MLRVELENYLDNLLELERYADYCPNGLQVQGKPEIKKIISGVTACQALLDAAIAADADAILVHHGYFWKSENACITGMKRKRLHSLLQHDINLFAYHLPLDTHLEYGNNVQLAKQLGITVIASFDVDNIPHLFFLGELAQSTSPDDFSQHIAQQLNRKPLTIAGSGPIKTIAWCTGAAQQFIDLAIKHKADAYLSGEISEQTVHAAREANLTLFAAGHHATERYGVQALGQHLANKFGLTHQFVEVDNPV